MIRAMHYLAAALIILGFAYSIQIFYNVAAGIMLGFACGSWVQWKIEVKDAEQERLKAMADLDRVEKLLKDYIKKGAYDPNIPDGESCREK